MMLTFFRLSVISTPAHDLNETLESRSRTFQCNHVRFAANADSEVESAGRREGPLTPCFLYLFVDFDLNNERIILFDVVGFHLPERARSQLQCVEGLPIHEHIPTGKTVVRNSVGAFVVQFITTKVVRHWD